MNKEEEAKRIERSGQLARTIMECLELNDATNAEGLEALISALLSTIAQAQRPKILFEGIMEEMRTFFYKKMEEKGDPG